MPLRIPRGGTAPLRLAAALALAMPAATTLHAQVPSPSQMTPEQVQQLLLSRPDLANQLRSRLGASGLSPDQVRDRLRAAGYPDNMLDTYLAPGGAMGAGAQGGSLSGGTFDAMRSIGVLNSTEADSLMALRDSIYAVADSIERGLIVPGGRDTLGRGPVKLPIFGLSSFRRRGARDFAAETSGPVDSSYVFGPGDELLLILTGDVERAIPMTVSREGFVVIPQVGQIQVANQSKAQVENVLYQRLGRVYSGVRRGAGATTRFQLSVVRLRTIQLYVTGDVMRPGAYRVPAGGSALSALYSAGGPTDNGSLRRIEARRGSQLLGTIDLYDYLLKGVNAAGLSLASGDVLFVPTHGPRVKVTGEVLRPAIYELKPGETLRDLIADAGGFTDEALTSRLQIHRVLPPARREAPGRDRVVVDVSAESMRSGEVPPYELAAGDSVVVFPVADRTRAVVRVKGNVWTPGAVGFTDGMTLADALALAGGPKPDAYTGRVLVSRLRPDSTRMQLRSALADSTGRPVDDLRLQEDDEITVFSRAEFRGDRFVVVTGAVRKQGRLPYREGMTLRDAVLEASGLREDAYLKEAEVARLPRDRAAGQVATTIRVPLDSTFIFDRGPDGAYLGPPGLPAPAAGAPEFVLEPYDNVLILAQPQWELQRLVAITGQVNFPGHYALETRTERLTDLIARAGGLTSEAYPTGVQFFRAQDTLGRIGVDLPRALRETAYHDNLILVGGDSIHIPEYNPVVTVQGAVNAPIAVTWVKGKDIDFYVQAAGGYAEKADKGRAYVRQPSGKVESVRRRFLLADGKPDPLAGGVIFVPEKTPKVAGPGALAVVGTLATVLTALASLLIATRN
jgi:protein involved in polysaccharide export with SLBB domain